MGDNKKLSREQFTYNTFIKSDKKYQEQKANNARQQQNQQNQRNQRNQRNQ